jgi:uncharacterized repeat protein (TIGR03837 family)
MGRRWDLFCRVIDNYGDIGVCWRLAADLAARGETVRLWTDDASALRWMAPAGQSGVSVGDFNAADQPGEVVIEAFGCDPPPAFVARMASQPTPPLWINLEYLSAEDWVARSHGLPSPQANGLNKRFWFPGFTSDTGGLLREPGLLARRQAFARPPGPRRASVFCYANPMLPALARHFDGELWLTPGPAQQLQAANAKALPWTDQPGYDQLLWSCDLNFVRGEDSLVRAIWAGKPFVWQIYPQDDGVHRVKLEAFLDAFLDGASPAASPGFAADLRALWRAWNGFGDWPARWPDPLAWQAACTRWQTGLAALPDLVSRLQERATASG